MVCILDTINTFVEVTFQDHGMSNVIINCTFLKQHKGTNKSCVIEYGQYGHSNGFIHRVRGDSHSATSILLPLRDIHLINTDEVHFIVTASNDNEAVKVEGTHKCKAVIIYSMFHIFNYGIALIHSEKLHAHA